MIVLVTGVEVYGDAPRVGLHLFVPAMTRPENRLRAQGLRYQLRR